MDTITIRNITIRNITIENIDVINIEIVYKSWILFWAVYWYFGTTISLLSERKFVKLEEVFLVLFKNMFWTLIGLILVTYFPVRLMTDSHVIVKFIGIYLFTDIYFYHFHILLHSCLYKYHKMHHEFKYPYALTGLYCSAFETIFLNVFSTALGPIIFQLEPPYLYIWIFIVSFNTILSHSGNTFPYLVSNSHDKHHYTFNYNYGISPFFDYVHGTLYN